MYVNRIDPPNTTASDKKVRRIPEVSYMELRMWRYMSETHTNKKKNNGARLDERDVRHQ